MSARKFVIGAALVAAGLAGGSVAASDYPPDVPPQRTVLTSSQGGATEGPVALRQPSGQLPSTGSDTASLVMVAGGAVVAGAGLLVVTRRRRHPAPGS